MDDLKKDDQDWIMENVKEELVKPDEYEIELYLSTDGKHTVHYKADTPEGRRKGLGVAMMLFDAIKQKYGTKADMWGEAMKNGKPKEEVKPEVKEEIKTKPCELCGGTRKLVEGVKNGKKWAGWFCDNEVSHCPVEWINFKSKV